MASSEEYALLDFGGGRRLERFGEVVLDRPCPAAEGFQRSDTDIWSQADARFEGRACLAADGTAAPIQQKGRWTVRRPLPERWIVAHGPLRFELKRTDFGHVGLFPEQVDNWEWIARASSPLPLGEGQGEGAARNGEEGSGFRVQGAGKSEIRNPKSTSPSSLTHHPLPLSQRARGVPLKILNLFAYTGGSTLAAAAAGAEVVHVDAARNVVAWARRNAKLSGLADAPIRWIAEDAVKFVKRELKRGSRYHAVILDPPSYGHGPRGEVWRLARHLPRLLSLCGELTAGRLQFMLLTCHTPGYDASRMREMLLEAVSGGGSVAARQLTLRSADGRELPSGVAVRWERTIVDRLSGKNCREQ
jgi:23S rRNA (cytosine1962-C5)-methyltransferase